MSLLDQLINQDLGFLLDENVDVRVGKYLQKQGARVEGVPAGASDQEVAGFCKENNLILITNDTDFANADLHDPQDLPAIIVFRIHPPRFATQREAFTKTSRQLVLKDITHRTLLIYKDGVDIIG